MYVPVHFVDMVSSDNQYSYVLRRSEKLHCLTHKLQYMYMLATPPPTLSIVVVSVVVWSCYV